MDCRHQRIRCTNNVFYCLDCGAQVADPYQPREPETPEEKPDETAKKAAKPRGRKAKNADTV